MPSCALCHSAQAVVFCVNDDASLCGPCDTKFHSNPLSARHERRPLSIVEAPCTSTAEGSVESWDDQAAVVPQCAPSIANMFDDDLFPTNFVDDLTADLLAGPLDLPSQADLLTFDFDGVVPSISGQENNNNATQEAIANMFPLEFPSSGPVNPFIHNSIAEEALPESMMVPQEQPVALITAVTAPTGIRMAPKRARVSRYDVDFSEEEEDSDMEDDSDDGEFVLAPRRSHASRARREAAAAAAAAPIPEPELTRLERVARYRQKRARRNFKKTIRYQSRKAYAEIRPRIKGRFVSPEEYAAYTNGQQQFEAVVPVC
jgi:CCT motif/B-box zinc finger